MSKFEPRIVVTKNYLRTRADTFSLAEVEHVRVRRPWLPFAVAAAGGVCLLTFVFWSELYPLERAIGLSSMLAIVAASRVGRLKLESIVLRDPHQGVIWGEINELHRAKTAVEIAIIERQQAAPSAASRGTRST